MTTLKISSSETNMGESNAAVYEVMGILGRSSFGMGKKNQNFTALALAAGVEVQL